jgi:hypothetical protein
MLVFCSRRFEIVADSRNFTPKTVKLAVAPFV